MNTDIRPIESESLPRKLSVTALWLLAINGIIGAGIFGIPASAQALVGDFSPWLFVLCALLIAPVVLCFAELSSAFGNTGGPVVYVRTAFGPFAGFQAGWAYYIARLTAFAANLNLLVVSFGYFWPAADEPGIRIALLAVLTAAMVWVNVVGARAAMVSLGALTLLKLMPLLALAAYGASCVGTLPSPAMPPAGDLGAGLLLVIYAFVGFEASVVAAGEARNPQRDLPRALLWALLTVAVLYALIQLAAQQLVANLGDVEKPLLAAGGAWLGSVGVAVVALGILTSVGGNLLSNMFTTARISYRLGLDQQLPDWFAQVHARHATPANSILCYGIAAFALAASGSFVWLAVVSVLTRLLLYLSCIASMPAVRRQAGAAQLMRLPGGWCIPLLAAAVCVALLTQVDVRAVVATAALLAIGSVLYVVARKKQ